MEVVVVTHAELGDVDLHRVYDGEAAVPLLLRHHHSVTALWWLGNDIAGWTKTNTDIRSRVSTDDWQSDQTYTSNSERIGSVVTIILGMDVNQYLRSCWTLCHVEQHCWVVLTKLDHTTPLQKCYKDKVTVTLIFFLPNPQSTYGMGLSASGPSTWSCCQDCKCGRRPWPHSEMSARFVSLLLSRSNPRNAHALAVDGPGGWGTSPLSAPSHQTPRRDKCRHRVRMFGPS